MSWALIRLNEVAPVPWRNGGGVTRELLAWPSPDDWALRISVAEVERDGPFSQYPGVQRWFAVLSGGGVRLTVAGQVRELRALGQAFPVRWRRGYALRTAGRAHAGLQPDAAARDGQCAALARLAHRLVQGRDLCGCVLAPGQYRRPPRGGAAGRSRQILWLGAYSIRTGSLSSWARTRFGWRSHHDRAVVDPLPRSDDASRRRRNPTG